MVMTFIDGFKIDQKDKLAKYGADRAFLVSNVTRAFAHQIFVDGFYTADPHPGNLMVDVHTLKAVLLDFGLTKVRLGPVGLNALLFFVEPFCPLTSRHTNPAPHPRAPARLAGHFRGRSVPLCEAAGGRGGTRWARPPCEPPCEPPCACSHPVPSCPSCPHPTCPGGDLGGRDPGGDRIIHLAPI